MKNPHFFRSLLALLASLTVSVFAQTAPDVAPAAAAATPADFAAIRSGIDLLRADIKTEKAVIIGQNIVFTEDESAEFWPLYNEYNAAQTALLDARLALLKEYLGIRDTMTDGQAATLAGKIFDWEEQRTKLKRTWFKKFTAVVPAKKAAQFFQIENQINAALDLQLMDAMPLIK